MGELLGQPGGLRVQGEQVPQIELCVVLVRENILDVLLQLDMVDVEDKLGHDGAGGRKHGGDGAPASLAQGHYVLERIFSSEGCDLDLLNECVDTFIVPSKV